MVTKPKIPSSYAEAIAAEMNKRLKLAMGEFELPANHQPGMRVTKGGSSCANCKYGEIKEDGAYCNNNYFVKWHGESKLPAPADEYCSDWWEPK